MTENRNFKTYGHTVLKSLLISRLIAFKVPSSVATQMTEQICHWVQYHGEEWTVGRLKVIRLLFLSRLSGDLKQFPDLALNRQGHPKGSFSWLFKYSMRSRKGISRALKVLGIYKSFIRRDSKPSPKQLEKFFSSVTREVPRRDPSVRSIHSRIMEWDESLDLFKNLPIIKSLRSCQPADQWYSDSFMHGHTTFSEPRDQTWLSWCSSPSKSTRILDTASLRHIDSSVKENSVTFEQFIEPFATFCNRSPSGSKFLELLAKQLPGLNVQQLMYHYGVRSNPSSDAEIAFGAPPFEGTPSFEEHPDPIAGAISFIQEPGHKCRAIANPFRVYQWLTFGLGTILFGALRKSPNDFTFNQHEGVLKVQEALRSRKTVHCVDLSDATNNFPMALSSEVIKEGLKDPVLELQLSLFEEVSRMSWRVQGSGDLVKWTVGQPLGLFPSFAHFAVGHHALLQSICAALGLSDLPYAVLGDDVAIWDNHVHNMYISFLRNRGVPISGQKCFSSDTFAEFAGRSITPNQIYIGHRYGLVNDRNVISLAKEVGAGLVNSCRNDFQRCVVKTICKLPPPLGLGVNDKGRPLIERVVPLDFHAESRREPHGPKSDLTRAQQLLRDSRLFTGRPGGDWMVPTIQKPDITLRLSHPLLRSLSSVHLPVGGTLNYYREEVLFEQYRKLGRDLTANDRLMIQDFRTLPFDRASGTRVLSLATYLKKLKKLLVVEDPVNRKVTGN